MMMLKQQRGTMMKIRDLLKREKRVHSLMASEKSMRPPIASGQSSMNTDGYKTFS